jgi:hypothetical protein
VTSFIAIIEKFGQQGEKTGWTYIGIRAEQAGQIKKGCKKSFRVKGKIDGTVIKALALLPMGGGDFILPLNAELRRKIRKRTGEKVSVQLEEDKIKLKPHPELIACLKDEPAAFIAFSKLPPSHQMYYDKWIFSAKTDATRIKRMALTIHSLATGKKFGEMLKDQKKDAPG